MFDIDVPGGIRFQESEVLSPGNDFLTFDTGSTCMLPLIHVYNLQNYLCLLKLLQNGVKLEWGSAMTSDFRNWLQSTTREVHGTIELFNLPSLVLKAKHLNGSAFCWDQFA